MNTTDLSPDQKRQLLAQLLQKKRRFPLSFAQQRLWFLHQLLSGQTTYNLPAVFRLIGTLDLAALTQSLEQIVQRHEILRTSFVEVNGEPFQQVHSSVDEILIVTDLRNIEHHNLLELTYQEAIQPFNLEVAPLIRARLIYLNDSEALLLVTLHHIIADYDSLRILIRELSFTYRALKTGQPLILPKLPIQYADYAAWQRLQNEKHATQLTYWKQQLSHSNVLQLPTDYSRPVVQSSRGARQSFQLTTEMTAGLKAISRKEEATLFMTLLAAFQILLYRYTDQSDVFVGSTVTNRSRSEVTDMIGLFVNNLVFRTQIPDHCSVRELLQQVRETALNAYDHQDLPYEYLVEQLQPDRHLSHNPLFQVAFVLHQSAGNEAIALPDLTLQYIESPTQTSRFDLSLDMDDTSSGLVGVFEYSTDLFKKETIDRLIEHFKILLTGIIEDPDQRISELTLLTLAEQQQLLVEWNATDDRSISPLCFHQRFEQQAQQTPDAIALTYQDSHLTYAALNDRANQLAHYLISLDLAPEAPIALYLDRSLDLVIALLAVLKTGACYLPLDPSLPPERLAFMLNDAQAKFLITMPDLPSIPASVRTIYLNDGSHASITNPDRPITPAHVAYLLYTSGSTGTPKAVQILHSALSNFLHAMQQRLFLSADDRLLAVTTLSFDIAALELFLPLTLGASVVLASRETASDGIQLAQTMMQQQISVMQATPATWRMLLIAGWQGRSNLTMLCGGEALDGKLANQLLIQGKALWNLYGPTETTIWSLMHQVTAAEAGTLVPIGGAIANTSCYVLDRHLQPVPVGVAGELWIGGAGLARGYLKRPELTAEKFMPNPFGVGRIYRTGDRVRYLGDGSLEYLERIDHQVKLRGYRIELGEIEATLMQHPEIETAIVLLRQDQPDERQLVAYLCSSSLSQSLSPTILYSILKTKLPPYMIPSTFVWLDSFPLTPNGKLDRRALPIPQPSPTIAPLTPPRTPTEELLVKIWSTVLSTDAIGITDNFFELGGHSLLATRVMTQIRQVFNIELPLRLLFEQPTIIALSEAIATTQTGQIQPPIIPIQPHNQLSFAQQRHWFLSQLEPDSPFYNIPAAIQITGDLDSAILQHCFNEVLCRHEVLRTAFATVEGQPLLVVQENLLLELPLIDLSALPTSEQEQRVNFLVQTEANLPFSIATAPLLRFKLLRLSDRSHVLLLTLHHIIADGSSVSLLMREVATLYGAFRQSQPSPLPALPIQYADYAAWQRRWLQGDVLQTQLTYWQQQLQFLPPLLELPTDHPRPAVQTPQGSDFTFQIDSATSHALNQLSQRSGCTLFMLLLSAFNLLLYRYSHQEDIAVGTPIAHRNHTEIEHLIGCFANTLVLRTDLSGDPSFTELLQRVKQVTLGAYSHADLPFEQLVEAIQPQRSLSYSPLFQVMFIFQPATLQPVTLEGLTWSPLARDRQTAKFDLTLSITASATELIGHLEYSRDLFEPATIQRMAGHFQTLLQAIAHSPNQRLSHLPLLTAPEQQQLQQWNQTQRPYPSQSIHSLFEAQVEKTPDAIAVLFEQQHLTYAELNARANQLAHTLIYLGTQPEALIGVCLERSPDLIIALLGILKAGAAYVPLDPNYPSDRLAFIVQDAQASLVVTSPALPLSFPVPTLSLADSPIAASSLDNPNLPVSPHSLAYVIYTSGSTGIPKGVAIAHHSTNTLLHWAQETFSPAQLAGVLASTSICFDLSIFEIFVPLSWGGTVILAENALHLPELPAAPFVSLINTVPSAVAQLVTLNAISTSVHTINLAGEALSQALVQQLYQQPQIQHVFNLYGPSEDTTYSTFARVTPEQSPPIGRPIANTQAHILDRHLNPVPIGVVGELYLSGAGLARGYLNRPELTAEKFVPMAQGRLYRTGDRARFVPDGNIQYLGRLDHQVKLRGFRIELGEIEAALEQHPQVKQAIAHLGTSPTGHAQIIACIVLRSPIPALSLRAHLQTQLPDYMIPSSFILLDRLPLTPNGKLDRASIAEQYYLAPPNPIADADTSNSQPQTAIEQQLIQIWQQVLGISNVSVQDNFFAIGGDSILAIQVIAKARQAGMNFLPKQMFQAQTIAELAQLVQSESIFAEQGIITGTVPLTPIQHWFFQQNLSEMYHWNQAVLLEVGKIKPQLLEQAWQILLTHHDALRLRFHATEIGWQQTHALPEAMAPLTIFDLTFQPSDQQSQTIETTAANLQTCLDLSTNPLKIALFQCAESDRLLIIIHHLLIDGVSWRILLRDLQNLYHQLQQGQNPQLPPKTTSFQHWSTALSTYAHSPELLKTLEYWRDRPSPPLPVDRLGSNTMAEVQTLVVSLTLAKTQALLQTVPARYQTQINDALLTALIQTFAAWTGNSTLLIELEGHGREDLVEAIDLSHTVGWFTSLFPVWLNLESSQDLGIALKSIKEQLRQIPQRGFSYGVLRYLAKESVQAQMRSLPRPEVRFNYLGQIDQALSLPFAIAPEFAGAPRSPLANRDVLLEINGMIAAGQLRFTWSYSRAIYHSTTIQTLADQFIHHLSQLIQHCQSPQAGGYTPSDFPLMSISQAELDDLLTDL